VAGGIEESFVLTLGLHDYESLERLAPKRFVPPLTPPVVLEKRRLIRAVGELTGRMHWRRFCHRDYYWAHVMLRKEPVAEAPDLRLIDLQRVIARPWWFHRWRVKDLASLHYSVRHLPLTRADHLRFLHAYNAALVRDRRLMAAVVEKSERIARHDRRRAAT